MIRKLNHRLDPIKLSVHQTRAGLRTICTEAFRWPPFFPTMTPRRRAIGWCAWKIQQGQAGRNDGGNLERSGCTFM
jgi:hypothetical protein